MATITVKDLEMNKELDKKALKNLSGGWGCKFKCKIKSWIPFKVKCGLSCG